MERPHIFLDCDGVLADLDAHALDYFGMPSREYEATMGTDRFWSELEAKGDFYRSMPLMSDARDLYEAVRHLSPTILTGCPRGNWAESQKIGWAVEHFPGVPVITCQSSRKREYGQPGDVLIDDYLKYRHLWEGMGGVFIHHTSALASVDQLFSRLPSLLPEGAA